MSVEQAKSFIEKLSSDGGLRERVTAAENNTARLELAQAAGFDFTADEFNAVIDELSNEELSEDELDTVAGGMMGFDGKGNDVVTEEITFFRSDNKSLKSIFGRG